MRKLLENRLTIKSTMPRLSENFSFIDSQNLKMFTNIKIKTKQLMLQKRFAFFVFSFAFSQGQVKAIYLK